MKYVIERYENWVSNPTCSAYNVPIYHYGKLITMRERERIGFGFLFG